MKGLATALVLWSVLAMTPTVALADVDRFALVVANNRPAAGALQPLRYADDDGVRYARLFESAGVEVTLLSVLDADSQARHPRMAARSTPPTLGALQAAVAALSERVEARRAAGRTTELYFVFAGHADLGPNGEGRMHLHDGTLARSEFVAAVIGVSPADFNHVIIDACHAEALVYRRGGGDRAGAAEPDDFEPGAYTALVESYLGGASLDRHANTGVLLSSSARQEAHEWTPYRGGVFSHQVLSALSGAGDSNGDGVVEYSEAAAYVAAANRAVPDPALRPEVIYQPPARAMNRPLWQYASPAVRLLRLPEGQLGHMWLEDADGVRWADLHVDAGRPVFVALHGNAPHYLRNANREARVPGEAAVVDGRGLEFVARPDRARGAADDALRRGLFKRPFSAAFYDGFMLGSDLPPAVAQGTVVDGTAEIEDPLDVWPWVAVGAGAAAGLTAAILYVQAADDESAFQDDVRRTGLDDPAARGSIDDKRLAAGVLTGAAVVGFATAVTLWLMDAPTDAPSTSARRPGAFALEF
ncbi:MAG: caspase family protein [Planctomycetota bacterium]